MGQSIHTFLLGKKLVCFLIHQQQARKQQIEKNCFVLLEPTIISNVYRQVRLTNLIGFQSSPAPCCLRADPFAVGGGSTAQILEYWNKEHFFSPLFCFFFFLLQKNYFLFSFTIKLCVYVCTVCVCVCVCVCVRERERERERNLLTSLTKLAAAMTECIYS